MAANTPITLHGPQGPLTVLFTEASPSQRVECSRLAALPFAGPLSVTDYIERDAFLAQRPLGQNGGLRYWCLALEKDPSQVLATCKTIQRDVIVHDVSGTRQKRCYCIASVVTSTLFRQCGMASLLLEQVAEWIDGSGGGTASVLYTSIGDFYAKRGWQKIPALKCTLFCPRKATQLQNWTDRPANRLLTSNDIPPLCTQDVAEIKAYFGNIDACADEVIMSVLPTANLITWLHDRGDFISLKTNGQIPDWHGAINDATHSWLLWHHDFRKQALGIQRLRIPAVQDNGIIEVLAGLLLEALQEAYRWKLREVFVLSPSNIVIQAAQYLQQMAQIAVECKEQLGSVPSVRWKHSDQTKKVKLHLNEHYGWS